MAVATHVSRVSKDYAPFGFSVMETASGRITTHASATTGPGANLVLLIVDDDDIYIESVQVNPITGSTGVIAADNTNFVTVNVTSFTSGRAVSATHATGDTRAASLNAFASDTFESLTVATPVVPAGRVLEIAAVKSVASDASINSKVMDVLVRYRRKA